MKYILIFLAVLGLANCFHDRESLPGSYKLEKPESLEEQSTYALDFNESFTGKDLLKFRVIAFQSKEGAPTKTISEGSVSLKKRENEETNLFELSLRTSSENLETHLTKIFKIKDLRAPLSFVHENILYYGAIVCRDADCQSMAFSFQAQKPDGLIRRPQFYFYFLNVTAERDSYIFKNLCFPYGTNSAQDKLLNEPYYFMSLPEGSQDLVCYTR